jgi:DNA-binding CsgD family transcriptional regulator|tara:strand:- start:1864 stop:2463 length:600 start_codon:yes stop_codon:yes gene_type:complete
MLKQTLNIVQFPILHEILIEIKDILKFQLNNYENNEDFIESFNKKTLDKKNFTIITNYSNKNFIKNPIFDEGQIFFFKYLPLRIFDIIDKINVQLIKQKYNFQSNLIIKNYSLDINSRIITNNKVELKLTEREIDVLLFLNQSKTPQSIDNLQTKVWGYSSGLETHTVETHVYRLRKKIKDKFYDENFIVSHDNGYLIR